MPRSSFSTSSIRPATSACAPSTTPRGPSASSPQSSTTISHIIHMASQGLIWCGFRVILYDRACCNDCTCSPNKIFKYSNIFVRNLRIFEYIRDLTFWCFEYSNIFVSHFFYIRIRPKIFEYSNIFEYSLCSVILWPCWAELGLLKIFYSKPELKFPLTSKLNFSLKILWQKNIKKY